MALGVCLSWGGAAQAGAPPQKPSAPPTSSILAKYDELADFYDESQSKQKSRVLQIIASGRLGEQAPVLDQYYKRYKFPQWTMAKYRQDLKAFRNELLNELRRAKAGEVYDWLNNLVLAYMEGLAKNLGGKNFSPATRFNAMLMIGQLNTQEPPRPSDPPTPLPQALPKLLDALEDPAQIDVVRVAALLGIVRHCVLGVADAQIRDTRVVPVLTALASASAPPEGRTPEGHAWMRTTAIDGLAALKGLSPNQRISLVRMLGVVVAEEAGPLMVCTAAASALGKIDYQGISGVNAGPMVLGLGKLSLAVLQAQVAFLDKQEAEALQGGQSYNEDSAEEESSSEEEGDSSGSAVPISKESSTDKTARHLSGIRRGVKAGLNAVLLGLGGAPQERRTPAEPAAAPKGLAAIATNSNDKAILDKLAKAADGLIAGLDDPALKTPVDLRKKIVTSFTEIQAILGPAATAPAAGQQAAAAPSGAVPSGVASPAAAP